MPPSPPTDQTHHLRHFSAGLFLILFAFFSIQLALFTLAHSHSTSTPAILIALLIALYLALIPAAAAHGALSALASLAKESLTKYGLLPPPQPPSPTPTPVQEVQPEADHPVIHAIKVSTLGVPAMSHALANVCIRVVVESGVKVVWHWTPRVVSVCRSVVEYVVKVVQDVLPGLYPYLEKGVVFVVTWTPVLWRYGREGVVYAWRGLVVVSVWVGKVVHDAWDPVIVPLFLGLTALISDAVVGIRRVAELASKEAWRLLGVLHQWAEGVVTWGIEVSHWLNVILTPYWERVKAFGIWAANICGKVFETVSATIHSVAEQVVQLCIDWKVFEMMRHIVVGIVRLARVVKSWGVILSRWVSPFPTFKSVLNLLNNRATARLKQFSHSSTTRKY
ncbi:hypothetical protein BCR33DRAFT_224382 [Rhizoclosmatium globosum]|uniref:Uncharacterized protein n=1 Tax=Rhizoclosmatium globosum TaxID=329046 RepID=A0A1Y2CBV2_9FUNG|nr:hypothetical protein BCR33DRAFT_224382 [Rhizoclosmatium globosum]|eukprot:ORY44508.1 hypothetical protein BCR33DRAFT_224382 [Rhizoclosmatium globosum]